MKKHEDFLEITYRSIECFANDGKLVLHELESLLAIALRDGVVDDNEKRVLSNIFSRLNPAELSAEVVNKIQQIKNLHF